jgi:hypothetical protein
VARLLRVSQVVPEGLVVDLAGRTGELTLAGAVAKAERVAPITPMLLPWALLDLRPDERERLDLKVGPYPWLDRMLAKPGEPASTPRLVIVEVKMRPEVVRLTPAR